MKWLFLNARNRIAFAMKNPAYAFRSIVRELIWADERFLAVATGRKPGEIRRFLTEPASEHAFLQHLRSCTAELQRASAAGADLYAKKILIQYAIVRALAPDVILETGVASGVSSSYLLLALHRNQHGSLYSIDIGDPEYLPPGRKAGWVVPDWLRERWHFQIGDTSKILGTTLEQLGHLDIFIHDSLHTYKHMLFEFNAAYPHLRSGGILVADDALWNTAFKEFQGKVEAQIARILRGVGVLRKP